MNKNSYYTILFSIILSFVAMIGSLFSMESFDFVVELSIIFGLMIAAAVLIYLMVNDYRFVWPFATVYFAINILNSIYLYFVGEMVLVIIYALLSFIGIFVSLTKINRKEERGKVHKEEKYLGKYAEPERKVAVKIKKDRKVAVVGKKPAKKGVRSPAAKKSSKAKPKANAKKTARKSSAKTSKKKASKSVKKKSSKKAAKRSPAKKKSSKKTAKKAKK